MRQTHVCFIMAETEHHSLLYVASMDAADIHMHLQVLRILRKPGTCIHLYFETPLLSRKPTI